MTELDVKKIVEDKFNGIVGFDPLTIISIISAAIYLYKAIKECRQKQMLLMKSAKRKGLAYRLFVRNKFLDKMNELKIDDQLSEEILEDLRVKFTGQLDS